MAKPCDSCGALAPTCDKCNQTWLYRRAGWLKTKNTVTCPTCCWKEWCSFGTTVATRAEAAEQLCKTCIRNHPTDITVPEIDGGARGPSGSAEASSSSAGPPPPPPQALDQEASPNLCEVIVAKCIHGNESASLNHVCPIESIEILPH